MRYRASIWCGTAALLVCGIANAAPAIYASPIHAGCKAYRARTCQIVAEPFTINIAAGKQLAQFQIQVDGKVVYDWRPDASNPPAAPSYAPSRVALGFGIKCSISHTVSLVGRDTGDSSLYTLGSTAPITCPAAFDPDWIFDDGFES